jgi:hypothetical protein
MTKDDRSRADARFNKTNPGKIERDAALKAVTDNMAKLKALRLAREANEPPQVKEAGGKGSGIGGLAGGPAKRRTPDLDH